MGKEYPTLKIKLKMELKFQESINPLWKILKPTGIKFKSSTDGRKCSMERTDTVAARVPFLRKTHNISHSQAGATRPIIFYLDETWFNKNHSQRKIWQESNDRVGLKLPEGKGGRVFFFVTSGRLKLAFWKDAN
jgi:hypothetical protein